jgi:hypothetical protein
MNPVQPDQSLQTMLELLEQEREEIQQYGQILLTESMCALPVESLPIESSDTATVPSFAPYADSAPVPSPDVAWKMLQNWSPKLMHSRLQAAIDLSRDLRRLDGQIRQMRHKLKGQESDAGNA